MLVGSLGHTTFINYQIISSSWVTKVNVNLQASHNPAKHNTDVPQLLQLRGLEL
jgi:hypothetical protein